MSAKRVAVLATGAAAAVAGALHLKRKKARSQEMASNGSSANGARDKASSWTADAEDNLVDLRDS